jgi:uncharacterized BrkB/YihY/UPF0761 family membrane protein
MGERPESHMHTLAGLARATYAAFTADSCRAYSAALVYYSTLSVVPLVVMVFALPGLLLGLVSRPAAERLTKAAGEIFGPQLADVLANALALFACAELCKLLVRDGRRAATPAASAQAS